MAQTFIWKVFRGRQLRLWLLAALSLWCGACAATPPPDASGPRSGEPPYPVKLVENPERRQATLAAWERLTAEQGTAATTVAPELQPVTATIRSLNARSNATLFLPKVGDPASQDKQAQDEATTESLRRFINSNARLFGAEPQQLSLVLLTDAADGTKKAKYQQRPFRYPLANGFGALEISFTNDRRILEINSTCIPEIEQLQRAGAGIRPRLSSDEVARRMQGRAFTYTDSAGNPLSYTIQPNDSVNVRQLVIYPVLRSDQPAVLDFHLAWEILVNREPQRVVYLDAITDDILAVTPL
jgi:hypothetical protein